jgi:hypothetical protein
MTVYVIRQGQLVEKGGPINSPPLNGPLSAPMVSRFEPMASPVTGETISSWRQRDADMQAVNAFDGRDLPKDHVFSRGLDAQAKELSDARQRDYARTSG